MDGFYLAEAYETIMAMSASSALALNRICILVL